MNNRWVFRMLVVVSWALGYLGGAALFYLHTGKWAWHLGG